MCNSFKIVKNSQVISNFIFETLEFIMIKNTVFNNNKKKQEIKITTTAVTKSELKYFPG